MTINIDLLLTDSIGVDAAVIYATQSALNESYAHDYHIAYAYGDENSPLELHKRLAALGAAYLNLEVQDYLDTWEECVEAIENYNDLPEEFKDNERYLLAKEA